MLGQRERILFPMLFQPFACEPMPERPIPIREHRISPLPQQRMPEGELILPGKTALRTLDDHLPLDELPNPLPYLSIMLDPAEQRRHAAYPERLPEDARRPENPPRLIIE